MRPALRSSCGISPNTSITAYTQNTPEYSAQYPAITHYTLELDYGECAEYVAEIYGFVVERFSACAIKWAEFRRVQSYRRSSSAELVGSGTRKGERELRERERDGESRRRRAAPGGAQEGL